MHYDDRPIAAFPIFPDRVSRYSAININRNSSNKTPEDLMGNKVGQLAMYGNDADV